MKIGTFQVIIQCSKEEETSVREAIQLAMIESRHIPPGLYDENNWKFIGDWWNDDGWVVGIELPTMFEQDEVRDISSRLGERYVVWSKEFPLELYENGKDYLPH